jgi:hypothetical protein
MNSSRRLPRAVIEQISGPRFDNPLFRLIATYTHARWMLSRGEPWRPDDELVLEFDVALASLAHDLPGCPDLSALQALRGEVVGQPAGVAPLASPPMFRLGLNAILRGTLRDPSLVAEGSLLDRISERMLNDSPWTSWSPIGRPHPLTGRGVVPGCDVVPDEMAGMDGDDSEHMGWLREHVLGALKRRVLRKLTRSDQQLSLVELAGTARTTPMAVRRAVQDLVRSVESDGVDRLRLHPELARWLKSEAGRNDLFRLMNER